MNQTKRKLLSAALAMVMVVQAAMPAVFAMESEEPAAKTITGFTALAQTDYTLPLGADENTISHVLTFPETITAEVEYITTVEVVVDSDENEGEAEQPPAPSEDEDISEDEATDQAPTTTLVEKLVSEQVELAITWESDSVLTTEEAGEFTYTAVLLDSDKGKYDLADGVSLPKITVYVEAAQPTLLCLCATLCIEGSSNPDCNICAAEGADLAECKGEAPMLMMSPLALGDPITDFALLKEAIKGASAGATITLGADITTDENLIINKALTLNLNGQTLSMGTGHIDITTAVNFTVADRSTSAAGKITSKHMCVIKNSAAGTVTVNGGTVTGISGTTIWNSDTGTVTVNGGTVSATYGSTAIGNDTTGAVNVTGGTVTADTGKAIYNFGTGTVNVSGGTVSATAKEGTAIYNNSTGKITIRQATGKTTLVTSVNTSTTAGTIYLATVPDSGNKNILTISGGTVSNTASPEGYSVYFNPSEVTLYNLASYYTKNGGTVGKVKPGITDFASLKEAVSTASTGATITLGADITADESLIINKVLTFDLAGQTLDMNSFSINVTTGNLTVSGSGGTITGSGSQTIQNNSTVNVTGGTVTTSDDIAIQNNGTVNVSGGTVSATGSEGIAIYSNSTGAVNVYDGTVSATGSEGIAIYSNSIGKITISQAAGKATLVTSTNTTQNKSTIYLNAVPDSVPKTVLEITGGTVSNTASGGDAILNNGIGTINVSGGKVSATGKARAIINFTTGTVNVSGGKVYTPDEGSSTILNNGAGIVNISGGTVTTDGNAAIDNLTNGTVNVSGGTVSANRGVAITNSSGIGKITISQAEGKTTLVTSANEREGTIGLYSVPISGDLVVLEITGGTVSNIASPEGISVYFEPKEVTSANLSDYYTKTGGTVGKVYPAITDFASLKAAASTASAGATLTLGAGTYTATESLSINKNLSLDLNGQILDMKSFSINITNEGNLTVTDTSSDSGKITGSTTTISNDGVVSVNSGTVEATSGGIAIQNNNTGTVNVSGGAVTTDSGAAIYNDADGAVNVSAGTVTTGDGTAIYNNSTGKITISQAAGKTTLVTSAFPNDDGGTIYLNAVPTSGDLIILEISGGTVSNTASTDGCSVYFSPSEVTLGNLDDYYTKTGGTVGKVHPAIIDFASLKAAASTARAGVTLTLSGGNYTATDNLSINKSLSLDLNGQILDMGSNSINVTTEGDLTVMDTPSGGKIIGSATIISNGGVVSVNSGTVSATGDGIAIYNEANGAVNVNSGTVSATSGNAIYNYSIGKITISQAAGKTTLVTSAFANNNGSTIYLNAVPGSSPKTVLEIFGGTISNTASPEGYSVYFSPSEVTWDNLGDYYTKNGGTVGKVHPAPPTPPSGGGGSSSSDNTTVTTPPATTENPKPATEATTTVKPTASNGTATVTISESVVNNAIAKAQAEAKKNGRTENGINITIKTDTGNATSLTANLPKASIDALVKAGVKETSIQSGVITIILNLDALKETQKQAGTDVTVTATKVANSTLSAQAKAVIGNRPVYDLSITGKNGVKVTDFGGGKVSVSIPYTLGADEKAANVIAYYIDSNGKVEEMPNSAYDTQAKTLSFVTDHFSLYGVGYKANETTAFTDITNHWAKESIEFVAARGLLAGTGNNKFSPDTSMTRGMFVTALGRLAGADVSSYKTSSFTDVKAGSYYLGYIEWASKNGIVNGTGNGKFAPDQSISREQMAVIMQSYAKAIGFELPKAHAEILFADHGKISSYATDAVKTMQMAGILAGKNGNKFDPQGTATRAEVSAVLKRFVELVISTDNAQGWMQNDSGKWMFFENGRPVTGTKTIDGTSYTFDANGETADVPKNLTYGTYTVQKGDSFWSISRKYKCNIFELARINDKSIFSMLYVGDVLKVPSK